MADKLPEWPKEKPEHLGFANASYWERYERARAEAALARLRVAVKHMHHSAWCARSDGNACDCGHTEAVAAIGEVPKA